MQEKTTLIGLYSSQRLKMLLGQSQRTGPGANFDDDAPQETENVKRTPDRTPAREERAKDHSQNPEGVGRQYRQGYKLHFPATVRRELQIFY